MQKAPMIKLNSTSTNTDVETGPKAVSMVTEATFNEASKKTAMAMIMKIKKRRGFLGTVILLNYNTLS
ncbi:MAG: hypothetical protein A2Y62_20975 [Candidatus Fischerbacteria bacterium RBG_13_37_8]|uniref:Uncharacterized protein n=1 Tax=Candidatus Fischerbacteria bacterium RBG_13_37_8 TaxID=1817863 RepID=A0A1F5VWA6_9BACT|nr:MAG: hypothetical protein A2Y62_20975 [Candidatus Fischerbacteria bacterium RBG_13_37_8]